MSLCAKEIKMALHDNTWQAYRLGERVMPGDLKIGPHSIDVTLARKGYLLLVNLEAGYKFIKLDDPDSIVLQEIDLEGFVAQPCDRILGCTQERFCLNNPIRYRHESLAVAPGIAHQEISQPTWFHQVYDGRSTCGRLFLTSHQTAGYCDLGFDANITLEIRADIPIQLRAGMRIGQVTFQPVEGEPDQVYEGVYTDQYDSPKGPVLGLGRF